MRKVLLLCTVLFALCIGLSAKERYTRVYMFGVSLSFQDSVCYITPLQAVDSAYINKGDMLQERTLYACQLEYWLEEHEGTFNTTCTVLWSEKKAKLEKALVKVRRRMAEEEHFKVQLIDVGTFAFKREEHITE